MIRLKSFEIGRMMNFEDAAKNKKRREERLIFRKIKYST